MRVSLRNSKGFSLVELMVVVAIIGVLAAIAVPQYQKFTAKSKQSEAKSNLSALYSAERAFFSEWNNFSSRFTVIGFAPTGQMKYRIGFTADNGSPAGINGYSGPIGLAADIASNTYCMVAANRTTAGNSGYCQESAQYMVGVALAGATCSAFGANPQTFLAEASSMLGGTQTDNWTLDQSKVTTNTQDGLLGL